MSLIGSRLVARAALSAPRTSSVFLRQTAAVRNQPQSTALFSPFGIRSFASVGDKLPSVELHIGFPPKKHNLADFAKDKSILLVGLPGAFTPTWYVLLAST